MATKQQIRVRRCQVCGAVNESENYPGSERVAHRCSSCGKHLAPFYFFDESELTGVGDDRLVMSLIKARGRYSPIMGIFALWSDEDLPLKPHTNES